MTTSASAREQHAAQASFIAGEMEGGKADVGEFFLAERGEMAGRKVRPLLRLTCRHRGRHRASRQRKSQPGNSECRHCGFGHLLLFRSLLRPLHSRILHVGSTILWHDPTLSKQSGQDSGVHEMQWGSFRLYSS
jgi:hypothetical protein